MSSDHSTTNRGQFSLKTLLQLTAAIAVAAVLFKYLGFLLGAIFCAVALYVWVLARWPKSGLAVAAIAVTVALLMPHFLSRPTKPMSQRSVCLTQLNVIATAMLNYEMAHGRLPPPYVVSKDGKHRHSRRVLLLPYLERRDIYDLYRFDEPWNGPNNKVLVDLVMEVFHCPTDPSSPLMTSYVVVVGTETAFPPDRAVGIGSIHRGDAPTILLVECSNSGIHWAEPRDLDFASLTAGKAGTTGLPRSGHAGGLNVVFSDRNSRFLSEDVDLKTLRALLTVDGSEKVGDY